MEIRPILSALLRNRTGAILVGLQIALTLAVVANAFFIIAQRVEHMARPTGIASEHLFVVQSYGYAEGYRTEPTVRADLATLRAIPGVVSAAQMAQVPLSNSGSGNAYKTTGDPQAPFEQGNYFEVDEAAIETLGLELVAGRNFRPEEIVVQPQSSEFPKQVILSRAMAEKLYGTHQVVGRLVYSIDGSAGEVIGVYDRMMGSWPDARTSSPYQTVLHPMIPESPTARYAVRTRPGERDRVMAEVERQLGSTPGRMITRVRSHEETIERAYRPHRRMVFFLGTLVALMTAVTALGIVGLATFQVNARRKQIGTRRAVGARRGDIVRYFLVENGLLAGAGVFVGAALAYGFSGWLTTTFQLPTLHPGYVAATALGIVLLGQLAVAWPARRAAAIPPAVATRTV